jgi:hypothetical protein
MLGHLKIVLVGLVTLAFSYFIDQSNQDSLGIIILLAPLYSIGAVISLIGLAGIADRFINLLPKRKRARR